MILVFLIAHGYYLHLHNTHTCIIYICIITIHFKVPTSFRLSRIKMTYLYPTACSLVNPGYHVSTGQLYKVNSDTRTRGCVVHSTYTSRCGVLVLRSCGTAAMHEPLIENKGPLAKRTGYAADIGGFVFMPHFKLTDACTFLIQGITHLSCSALSFFLCGVVAAHRRL